MVINMNGNRSLLMRIQRIDVIQCKEYRPNWPFERERDV